MPSSTRHTVVETPIGELTLVRDDVGISGVYFPDHWTGPDATTWGPRVEAEDDGGFDELLAQLGQYLAGELRDFDLALSLQGSLRSRQVWDLLQQIPYGETTTYGELARQVGDGISARAIGGFVGHNPISIVIACHRVVGSTGSLTGYAGGLERKRALLELEGAIAPAEPALW